MRTILLPALLLATVAADLTAQTWTQLAYPTFPNVGTSPRRSGGLAFDLLNGQMLVYGGLQSTPTLTLNETWRFDGTTWTQLTPTTTPPPRWGHRMVLDTRRARLVTFGGRSPTTTANANDTWEWDGTDWQQVFPTASPSARGFYGMAYDERRGKTVIYGNQSGTSTQTWEYDGTTWTQVVTPTTPPGLESPAMAYDKGRGVIVMFGGYNATPPGTMYGTTWEYDGVDWTLRTLPTNPLARYRQGMAYDDARGRIVMYGGFNGGALQDTWEYDGNDWVQTGTTGPVRSTEGYMEHDPIRRVTYYIGGSGPGGTANEVWAYTGANTAIAAPFGQGCPGSGGVPTLVAQSLPILGQTYQIGVNNLPPAAGFTLLAIGLSNFQSALGFLPVDLGPFGMTGCRLEVSVDLVNFVGASLGSASFGINVPNNPRLTNLPLYAQAHTPDTGAPNGFGTVSTALHAVVGN